jgi:GNAT superfamily N-acetyltransferase
MRTKQLENRMRGWLASGEYKAQIVMLANAPVGYVCWREDAAQGIFLRQFFITPAARLHGAGRRAVAHLREHVWARGVRITLEVRVGNTEGHDFWKACGFRDFAVTMEYVPASGVRGIGDAG